MRRGLPHPRAVAWLLVVGIALGTILSASGVFAADDPPAKGAAAEETADSAEGGASASELAVRALEERLNNNPRSFLALLLLKFVPLGIGVLLLILWWLKRDRIRGGAEPPPLPVRVTVPLPASLGYVLAVLAMVVFPMAATLLLLAVTGTPLKSGDTITEVVSVTSPEAPGEEPNQGASRDTGIAVPPAAPPVPDPKDAVGPGADVVPAVVQPDDAATPVKASGPPLWIAMLAMALGSLPVAFFLLRRRARVQAAGPAYTAEGDLIHVPAPTPPPPAGRAIALGFGGYCMATVAVVPVSMLWILVLELSGVGANLQELVTKVLSPTAGYEPWLIVFFGVVVAPFVEETIFRGTLYPATKRAFGGDRRAAWRAALLVSLVFACIHTNLAALLPLFALAMVLTWIMETTNSLMACIVAHAVHNAFSLVPLLLLKATS